MTWITHEITKIGGIGGGGGIYKCLSNHQGIHGPRIVNSGGSKWGSNFFGKFTYAPSGL